jgi:hypothetical protein
MAAVFALPLWALVTLGLMGAGFFMAMLHLATSHAKQRTELHEFKIAVITLRNEHLRQLAALYSGDDPNGEAASMFGPDSESTSPESPAVAQPPRRESVPTRKAA